MRIQAGWRARGLAFYACLAGFCSVASTSASPLPELVASERGVSDDLTLILAKAGLDPALVSLGEVNESTDGKNMARFRCEKDTLFVDVTAAREEWASTFYFGLQTLGFLFPHPRMQLSPDSRKILTHCDQSAEWQPRFARRGFHFHTQHPNEWVYGFLLDQGSAAEDTVRWLARNGMNTFEPVLLRGIPLRNLEQALGKPFSLARSLGVHPGVAASFDEIQQRAYRLVPLAHLESGSRLLARNLRKLLNALDFDFISLDLGLTEFTHNSPRTTLRWIETARKTLAAAGKKLFVKAHVSHPTADPAQNYNFITQFSDPSVGVLPHTVLFYALTDPSAPVYGRKDFSDMLKFMNDQAKLRTTWFYPETSYWIGMDSDIPLFLTDYLVARSTDMDTAEAAGVDGVIDFTSGQEFGYWLMDWTVALLNQRRYQDNPLAGLALLGEDTDVWSQELQFQSQFFKTDGLIQALTSENLFELIFPFLNVSLLARPGLGTLAHDGDLLATQIESLTQAVSLIPSTEGIKNDELRALVEVTHLRLRFCLALRQAIAGASLAEAEKIYSQALELIERDMKSHDRYPELPLYIQNENPTSYKYGYLWPAATLRYWKDEIERVRDHAYHRPDFEVENPWLIVNPF